MPDRPFDPLQFGYSLKDDFNRRELGRLLLDFESSVKRSRDRSLARRLKRELLQTERPRISGPTFLQLAKWCETGGIYSDGMDVARRMSLLLFGRILDRDELGV